MWCKEKRVEYLLFIMTSICDTLEITVRINDEIILKLHKGRVAWDHLGYLCRDVYTQGPFAGVDRKGWHNKG